MSEIYKALLKFQGLVRGVKKDAKNPAFKSNYATLEQVEDTIRPHMQECGLVWFQFPGAMRDGALEVKTTIAHAESGEVISGTMEMPLGKKDPQGAGSAMTYAMRYSLMAALGLPPTDDDAEAAIDRDNKRPAQPANDPKPVSKASARPAYTTLETDMFKHQTTADLARWWKDADVKRLREQLPDDWHKTLHERFVQYGTELRAKEQDPVDAIKDQFQGAKVKDERVNEEPNYLAAGE